MNRSERDLAMGHYPQLPDEVLACSHDRELPEHLERLAAEAMRRCMDALRARQLAEKPNGDVSQSSNIRTWSYPRDSLRPSRDNW